MPTYFNPPDNCDLCKAPIVHEFYDGKTQAGPWANMCPKCKRTHGMPGLGTGIAQHYMKQDDGKFHKTV